MSGFALASGASHYATGNGEGSSAFAGAGAGAGGEGRPISGGHAVDQTVGYLDVVGDEEAIMGVAATGTGINGDQSSYQQSGAATAAGQTPEKSNGSKNGIRRAGRKPSVYLGFEANDVDVDADAEDEGTRL